MRFSTYILDTGVNVYLECHPQWSYFYHTGIAKGHALFAYVSDTVLGPTFASCSQSNQSNRICYLFRYFHLQKKKIFFWLPGIDRGRLTICHFVPPS